MKAGWQGLKLPEEVTGPGQRVLGRSSALDGVSPCESDHIADDRRPVQACESCGPLNCTQASVARVRSRRPAQRSRVATSDAPGGDIDLVYAPSKCCQCVNFCVGGSFIQSDSDVCQDSGTSLSFVVMERHRMGALAMLLSAGVRSSSAWA
jgi:hypothetical protein